MFLKAQQVVEACQQQPGVLAGATMHKNRWVRGVERPTKEEERRRARRSTGEGGVAKRGGKTLVKGQVE